MNCACLEASDQKIKSNISIFPFIF